MTGLPAPERAGAPADLSPPLRGPVAVPPFFAADVGRAGERAGDFAAGFGKGLAAAVAGLFAADFDAGLRPGEAPALAGRARDGALAGGAALRAPEAF